MYCKTNVDKSGKFFKGEYVVTAILPSHMEMSFCTSDLFIYLFFVAKLTKAQALSLTLVATLKVYFPAR